MKVKMDWVKEQQGFSCFYWKIVSWLKVELLFPVVLQKGIVGWVEEGWEKVKVDDPMCMIVFQFGLWVKWKWVEWKWKWLSEKGLGLSCFYQRICGFSESGILFCFVFRTNKLCEWKWMIRCESLFSCFFIKIIVGWVKVDAWKCKAALSVQLFSYSKEFLVALFSTFEQHPGTSFAWVSWGDSNLRI